MSLTDRKRTHHCFKQLTGNNRKMHPKQKKLRNLHKNANALGPTVRICYKP